MAENKKSNQADAYMESMKAYQKTYDFLLYLYPILSQFPKFEKFTLQSQIKTAVFEMLKSVIRFRKTGTKSHIYNANGNAWKQRRKKGQNKKQFHYMIYL